MSSPVNLDTYRGIKEIVTNYPNSIKTLDKCLELLYNERDNPFMVQAIEDLVSTKIQMQFILGLYEEHLKGIKLNE